MAITLNRNGRNIVEGFRWVFLERGACSVQCFPLVLDDDMRNTQRVLRKGSLSPSNGAGASLWMARISNPFFIA